MTDNEKKDNRTLSEKIIDYLLIFWLIFVVFAFVVILQNVKVKSYIHKFFDTSANAQSVNEISNYDEITDLTGTSWEINENLTLTTDDALGSFFINFSSDDVNFSVFKFSLLSPRPPVIGISYDNTVVFSGGSWGSDNYRMISISDGSDVSNITLISWLQSNATQIQIGYSSTITLTNCTCNKSSESGLSGQYSATITANTGYYLSSVSTTLGTITYSNNNKVATISISDVTEDFTISATASLIYHNISYNLGNVVITSNKPTQIDEISSISITFQPFSNFVLPQYINVEGVTEYIWNDETGVLTLVNAYDNVEITINAEYKSGQYTFVELIDSVTLVPVNTFFNLFNFELLGVNIYNLLLSALILFVIIKIILKVFK